MRGSHERTCVNAPSQEASDHRHMRLAGRGKRQSSTHSRQRLFVLHVSCPKDIRGSDANVKCVVLPSRYTLYRPPESS